MNLTDMGANLPDGFMATFDPLPVMVIVPAIEIYFMVAKQRNMRHLEMHPLKRIGENSTPAVCPLLLSLLLPQNVLTHC